MSNTGNNVKYSAFLLLQCLLWGIGNPLVKIGLESFPPFLGMAIRFGIAFLIFLLLFRGQAFAGLNRRNFWHCVLIGVFTAWAYLFSVLAMLYTTAVTAGFLLSLAVVFTPFLSRIFLKQPFSKAVFAVIAIVVAGLYLLCGGGGGFRFGLGELFAVSSSVSFAVALTYSSKYVGEVGAPALSIMQVMTAAVIALLFGLIFEDTGAIARIAAPGWGVILYLAIACTCVAYLLQNSALKHVSAVFASLAYCTEPVFTAFAAYLILGETLGAAGIAGGALIMAGLVFASLLQSRAGKNGVPAQAQRSGLRGERRSKGVGEVFVPAKTERNGLCDEAAEAGGANIVVEE